ncbi:MAG: KpsF/GutQ family sugar-phosphate isomerase [Candidatus Paracaedibacteraceae bacterium]|nr:KpsF/GutQ family sugar-phosphate isomerase [Candidatus Paracaedibacteraceae bacterium]
MTQENQSIAQAGRDVLAHEANGLLMLADSLGESFDEAVQMISKTQGRLIVSGVGKSGHVGRKIAATFASTGQPAFFVHAAEAAHGDLGMITKDDTLLLISYSGEANELHSLLHYASRLQLPVISITSKSASLLAIHSTISLVLPDVGEACPMGLAPTTSTTLTMGLGDALAVALLSVRGFTKHDFNTFHPGGNLGHQLRSIRDFMHTGERVPLVPVTSGMTQCLMAMSTSGFGCVGIIDDASCLVGIITDGDLRRNMTDHLLVLTAKEVMTASPITILPNALMGEALALFEKKSITNVFVVDTALNNNNVLGILHLHDCLRGKII